MEICAVPSFGVLVRCRRKSVGHIAHVTESVVVVSIACLLVVVLYGITILLLQRDDSLAVRKAVEQ